MRAYLIIFSRGHRYIEELSEFEASYPYPVIRKFAERFNIPRNTTFSGISKLITSFNLRNKKGKKAWKRFVRRL